LPLAVALNGSTKDEEEALLRGTSQWVSKRANSVFVSHTVKKILALTYVKLKLFF